MSNLLPQGLKMVHIMNMHWFYLSENYILEAQLGKDTNVKSMCIRRFNKGK